MQYKVFMDKKCNYLHIYLNGLYANWRNMTDLGLVKYIFFTPISFTPIGLSVGYGDISE